MTIIVYACISEATHHVQGVFRTIKTPHLVRPHLVMAFRHGWVWKIGQIRDPGKNGSYLDVVNVNLDEAGVV